MKVFIALIAFSFFSTMSLQAQEDLRLMRLNKVELKQQGKTSSFETPDDNFVPAIVERRHNIMGYKPIKHDGYQVVSAYQANTNFDLVYFIDKSGHTTKKLMAVTAPQNFDGTTRAHYDSMNPYGSTGMTSVLINVLLGSVINRGLGLL